jgi:K+-transporting ATPase c subunit
VSRDEDLALSAAEMDQVRRIAKRDGISEAEAATRLVQSALARRVRKRTGKGPAKVYGLRKK